jgi:hypothetical protein
VIIAALFQFGIINLTMKNIKILIRNENANGRITSKIAVWPKLDANNPKAGYKLKIIG